MKYLWEVIISLSINSVVLNEEGYHTENIKTRRVAINSCKFNEVFYISIHNPIITI